MVTLETSRDWKPPEAGVVHGFFLLQVSIPSLKLGGWAQLGFKTPLGILPSDEIPSECYELPHPSPSSLDQICVCVMQTSILVEGSGRSKDW